MTDLLIELKRRPLLCDGAMGTQLLARGLPPGAAGERWNVERPEVLGAVHRAYREAGCDLITTNTFGGSRIALARHELDDRTAELNCAGARLARDAAGPEGWVLGDIGPFGGFLEPVGETDPKELLEIFAQQATALYEGGAHAAIVETMSDTSEMAIAIEAARSAGDRPVIATFAFGRGDGVFRTLMGTTVAEAVARAINAGADVVGANCGVSLSLRDYVELGEELVRAAGGVPVIVQPNAGSPCDCGGTLVYAATPADMADCATKLLAAGVRIVGGCCGTTPAHLAAMGLAMRG